MKWLFFLISFNLLAQTPQETIEQFQKEMEEERRAIFKMLGHDFDAFQNGDFEKLIQKFMERSQRDFFKDENFNQFFKEWNPYGKMGSGESHWIETPKERILIIKIDEIKDTPIDIKINKGVIKVSAQKKTQGELYTFNQSYSVPNDTDPNSAVIENKNGEIQVRFTKKGLEATPIKKRKGDPVI